MPTSRSERLFRFGGLAASIGMGAASELFKRVSTSTVGAPPTCNTTSEKHCMCSRELGMAFKRERGEDCIDADKDARGRLEARPDGKYAG